MKGENKLTKKLRDIPLIKYSVNNILNSPVDEIIIVLGYEKEILERIIGKNKKIKFVFNENFKNGIASSIKVGVKNLSKDSETFIICLGDMPLIKTDVYIKLIQARNNKEIIVPVYKGKQGNPVLFSKSMKKNIMDINGDEGAKQLFNLYKDKIFNLKINDEGVTKGYDTQENFIF